jgi:dTMP kinase
MSAPKFYGIRPPGIEAESLPGRLIVLEGTDGVGRSTQIALLREWLEGRGYAVIHTGFNRSELASRGILRAKRGNTLDPLTLNLFYATDFWDRLERHILPALRAGMIALVDRYIFTLIARAVLRGVPREWIEDVYGIALIPDKVLYLDMEVDQLLPRVIATYGLDFWESGQDYLRNPDLFSNYVEYQGAMLAEYRRLASTYGFETIDAGRPVGEVFASLQAGIEDVLQGMGAEEDASSARAATGAVSGPTGPA